MKLRFLFGSVLVALLGWIAFKDSLWTAWVTRGPPAGAPAPDPGTAEGWLMRPRAKPAAVWDSRWAVDIFMLPARPGLASAEGPVAAGDADMRRHLAERTQTLAAPLANIGPVYVPWLRLPGAASRDADWSEARSDLVAALAAYLETDNRGRAILFAAPPGSEPLLSGLAEGLEAGSDRLSDRLGGIVHFSAGSPLDPPPGLCGPAIGENCVVTIPVSARRGALSFLSPQLPGAMPGFEIDAPASAGSALTVRRETILAWLERNAARPAEPLGGLEPIEVAPIRRPGSQPTPEMRGRGG